MPLVLAGVAAAADPVNAAATLDRATITVGDSSFLTVYADAEAGYVVGDIVTSRWTPSHAGGSDGHFSDLRRGRY